MHKLSIKQLRFASGASLKSAFVTQKWNLEKPVLLEGKAELLMSAKKRHDSGVAKG